MKDDKIHTWTGVFPVQQFETENADEDPLYVRAAARSLRVLSAFHGAERPMSLTDVAKASGLDRSTTQRIVHTLRKLGYIERDEHDTGFVPGIRLYDHVFDAMRLNALVQQAVPILLPLSEAVGERVDLSLVDDVRLVYATRFPPKRQVLNAMMPGHSVPIYCTSAGWAVLAQMETDAARDVLSRSKRLRYTEHTLVDEDDILDRVRTASARGYAVAREQLMQDEIAIGAAITNSAGRPIGAVTITALMTEWTEEEFVRTAAGPLARAVNMLGR